jgi:hypothetical protein
MNDKPTNSSPKNLSGRTVAIILSTVWITLMTICLCVGAWPMALGFLIAPLFIPVIYYFSSLLGLMFFGIPFLLLGRFLDFILPKRFKDSAKSKKLYPIVLILPFLGLFGILLIIFRDFVAVTAVLLALGLIFGLPAFAKWLLDRRKSKKPIDPPSELGKQ